MGQYLESLYLGSTVSRSFQLRAPSCLLSPVSPLPPVATLAPALPQSQLSDPVLFYLANAPILLGQTSLSRAERELDPIWGRGAPVSGPGGECGGRGDPARM